MKRNELIKRNINAWQNLSNKIRLQRIRSIDHIIPLKIIFQKGNCVKFGLSLDENIANIVN